MKSDHEQAHTHSANHRPELEASVLCGCFYCLSTFVPAAIDEWIDTPDDAPEGSENETGTTALCPRCGIDSVIGSASGFPISAEFLATMRDRWFGPE
ncbi:hypothetical protein [Lysobacter sp. CA199]|uniref:hypothetical protein n=1 Tax=Lysobacter sp. CA199 TaxID=3455608 RepID=UPI003F8D28E5